MDTAHAATPPGHFHSRIIKPIKEMSLIRRGVPALVYHWGFLAGAGDMQSSLSFLLDLSHHALIRHSSKLYRESWFSRAGLAQKSVQSSVGHLWMSFKGFRNGKCWNVGLVQSPSLQVFLSFPPLIEKPLLSSVQSSAPLGRVKVSPQQRCEVRREGGERIRFQGNPE